jgi:adenine-specific DNA methylase
MIERHFQIPFVARLALAEKQIQQNYRPLIAVHKWFARRPGTLFRALILSELGGQRIEQTYFHGHHFPDKHILDPFMGGGTTVVEANRLGCMVTAADINPMAWWIVRQQIQDLDLGEYAKAAATLRTDLRKDIGHLFMTKCPKTGRLAEVKYFLWVKTATCGSCGKPHDLFPSHLIAQDVRHTANVFVCGYCGALFESSNRKNPGPCPDCAKELPVECTAGRNRSRCLHCNAQIVYPAKDVPRHRLFAIEYHAPHSPGSELRKGRLFKAPDAEDLAKFVEAEERVRRMRPRFIPEDSIPKGDETERLHRWGYRRYRDLFNARQLIGLELSCRWIARYPEERVREALATNLSDLLRYQNMLCRYDIMALKSLDIFSVHGFPVGLIQCESNILGIESARGLRVGSGGWLNITEKFAKAKRYCQQPFEVRHEGNRKVEVPIPGEWIGTSPRDSHTEEERHVDLICGDSTALQGSTVFDGVFTDPPYFGNVQYAELMDFCYVWLRKLAGTTYQEFASDTTRNAGELTGNVNMGRDLVHFTEGMSSTFRMAAARLKSGSPLVFTFHHNRLEAYVPLAVAILDAGLTCSASLPCPAEMGASIHINGTGSSVVDTVFVCRQTGVVPRRWIVGTTTELADLIRQEIGALADGGLKATQGDIRCIACGHMTRLAVWILRTGWKRESTTIEKMTAVQSWYSGFGDLAAVLTALETAFACAPQTQEWAPAGMVRETSENEYEIPF